MDFFKKRTESFKYQIIEVEKPVPVLHKEDSKHIGQLAEHPGFRALMSRLKLQKAALEATLRTQKHESLDTVYNLQAGINWINWLDKQVSAQAGKVESTPRPAYDLEETEFNRMLAALNLVGKAS